MSPLVRIPIGEISLNGHRFRSRCATTHMALPRLLEASRAINRTGATADARWTGGGRIRPPPGALEQHPMQPNQRCGAGAGTITIVSPPVLPFSPLAPSEPVIPVEPVMPVEPVIPVEPVAPVSPFSAGAPGAPCGPAGPGTGTATTGAGAGGTTTVPRSHALNASADTTAANTIEYLMMILPMCRIETARGIACSPKGVDPFAR